MAAKGATSPESRYTAAMLLTALALFAAQQSTDKLPPANPIPRSDADEGQVMAAVNALLGAINRSDGGAVIAATRPEGTATVAAERPEGTRAVRSFRWQAFAAQLNPGTDRLEERLGDAAIEIDGDIALVWAPYTFRVNGKVAHCGTDHFDLVRENGTWRVLNVTWSQRTVGCPA